MAKEAVLICFTHAAGANDLHNPPPTWLIIFFKIVPKPCGVVYNKAYYRVNIARKLVVIYLILWGAFWMGTLSLRAYNKEIDSLIEQNRLDEAIGHCRHILSKFPKHIDTYRLLGKAYLENGQNSNAADIFQRVLSAVPDDFIAHVGMSVIREEEGNLPASVLHMEKAFELQPYNSEIQIELKRLYGRRDGMEPPKVRLTQGALARIYIQGSLTRQGISELRSVIKENPNRYDLKSLLMEAYLDGSQLANAIDLASNILKKYPYNLAANRILARSLKTHDHPKEMSICTKRLYALSPYEAYISEHAPTVDRVPDRAITIDELDWEKEGKII